MYRDWHKCHGVLFSQSIERMFIRKRIKTQNAVGVFIGKFIIANGIDIPDFPKDLTFEVNNINYIIPRCCRLAVSFSYHVTSLRL